MEHDKKSVFVDATGYETQAYTGIPLERYNDTHMFDLIDANDEVANDRESVTAALANAGDAIRRLVDAVRETDSEVMFGVSSIGHGATPPEQSIAAVVAAWLTGGNDDHRIEMQNRQYVKGWKEARCGYAIVDFHGYISRYLLAFLERTVEKAGTSRRELPTWVTKYQQWKHHIGFWSNEREEEFRTCAIALNAMGDNNWKKFRDNNGEYLDEIGMLGMTPIDDEGVDKINELKYDSYYDTCSVCGNKSKDAIQANKYIKVCPECARRIFENAANDTQSTFVSSEEGERLVALVHGIAETLEKCGIDKRHD